MREVVLDTETTGLSPSNGDRVVEIGCVELINHVPTGETYQAYLNPEKLMDPSAEEVHGLTNDFLKDQPFFKDVADEFLNFISDSPLIIHNAEFDIGFLNSELDKAGLTKISISQAIDTLKIAREKFPGAQNSLDALCRRFDINNFDRELHGALLDSRILAEVYLELLGGKEPGLLLNPEEKKEKEGVVLNEALKNKTSNDNSYGVNDEEKEKHKKLLSSMSKTPIWGNYKN
jgi:DNA polymerase-3 subunit epsilon